MDPAPTATDLLHPEEDAELQEMVREAAASLDAPIALVSLVFDQIQYFKAYYGLPPELRLTRATRRDVSFCQYVVQSGDVFQVKDAAAGDPVASMLAETHQIASYLGAPVSVQNQVVGALCVMDTQPREFGPEERDRLAVQVSAVSRRLEELLRKRRRRLQRGEMLQSLADAFPGGAVSELARHARESIEILSAHARLAHGDLSPEDRGRAIRVLPDHGATETGLKQLLAEIEKRHIDLAERLESLAVLSRSAGNQSELPDVIEAALRMARPSTDPIGGVAWVFDERPMHIAVPPDSLLPGVVACLRSVAAALVDVGEHGPIQLRTTEGPLGWRLVLELPEASRHVLDQVDVGPLQVERSEVDRTEHALVLDVPKVDRPAQSVIAFRALPGKQR